MNKKQLVVLSLTVLVALAFAVFVWPTRYMYAQSEGFLVRVDRVGGGTEVLLGIRWTMAYPSDHIHPTYSGAVAP